MNSLKVHTVYVPGGKFTWKGYLPDEVEICAPFENQFLSAKNMAKWVERVEKVILPKASRRTESLEELIKSSKLSNLTRQELTDLAKDKGIHVIRNATKQWIIDQLQEVS